MGGVYCSHVGCVNCYICICNVATSCDCFSKETFIGIILLKVFVLPKEEDEENGWPR